MLRTPLPPPSVAPFRRVEFRERAEFDEYSKTSETLRSDRWLYEQSLATLDEQITLCGTCGICLTETTFSASTRGGESAAGGRVPNWREELVCSCKRRLCNRHRAFMHYILAAELIHPWTRVLGLGEMGAILPTLRSIAQEVSCWVGELDQLSARKAASDRGYHLVIVMEQLHAGCIRPKVLSALATQLVDGGRLLFTSPFDVHADGNDPTLDSGPIGWSTLPSLRENGFSDAKACMYWSEEFGYLGPLNFIFEASK